MTSDRNQGQNWPGCTSTKWTQGGRITSAQELRHRPDRKGPFPAGLPCCWCEINLASSTVLRGRASPWDTMSRAPRDLISLFCKMELQGLWSCSLKRIFVIIRFQIRVSKLLIAIITVNLVTSFLQKLNDSPQNVHTSLPRACACD